MTATTEHRKLTQAELVAEATERFGDDPLKWAFVCPSCGDIANGQDFSKALTEHPRKHRSGETVIASDIVGQECIGRTLGALTKGNGKYTGRGCDWTAYGLFGGPWEIALPNGRTMHAFPLTTTPC
ncbi:VVA0879 family protein [Streptomyces sp. NPDC056309]|uniref:VVA0879 family protein n=1 Tax=Streptomyces sp. NPDC056309 TaxID=3345781 RepID=UPI0035DC6514